MSKKKIIIIIAMSIVISLIIFVAITLYQIDVIMNTGVNETVNRDGYTLMSFQLAESSGNALSTEEGGGQSMYLSYETVYIDTPETEGRKEIELDETERKNLETDLLALIEKHNLREWDGYDEHLEVMDASHGFSFRVLYENEDEIVASGGFMFPDNYGIVFEDVKEVFVKHCN